MKEASFPQDFPVENGLTFRQPRVHWAHQVTLELIFFKVSFTLKYQKKNAIQRPLVSVHKNKKIVAWVLDTTKATFSVSQIFVSNVLNSNVEVKYLNSKSHAKSTKNGKTYIQTHKHVGFEEINCFNVPNLVQSNFERKFIQDSNIYHIRYQSITIILNSHKL